MSTPIPVRPIGPARSGTRNPIVVAIVVVLAVLILYKLLHHGNRYERMADSVTKAIAKNDMTPAAKYFNAINDKELQDRARVGALSNLVNAQGSLKSIKEDTPSGSDPSLHTFTATFDRGTLAEKFMLDADGKIVKFHIGPPTASQ